MRKKTYLQFRDYVDNHVFINALDKDIKKAWKLYNSEDSKYNDYSVEYCVDMVLEIKSLML